RRARSEPQDLQAFWSFAAPAQAAGPREEDAAPHQSAADVQRVRQRVRGDQELQGNLTAARLQHAGVVAARMQSSSHVRRLILLLVIALGPIARADVVSGPLTMAVSTQKRILVV